MLLNFLEARQLVVEVLFVFDIAFAFILIRYLFRKWRGMSGSEFWASKNCQAAGGLLAMITGQTILRGWSVFLFIVLASGGNIFEWETNYKVSLVGTFITCFGLIWVIRLFSPVECQERGWIAACAGAILFVGMMEWLT